MEKKVKFSVIIPSYNAASTVGNAVASVLNQHFEGTEIIVVDDGSTDNTKAIIEEHFGFDQVRYFYQNNGGPFMARAKGISEAVGEFLCFLDSDDVLAETYFVTLDRYLRQNPTVDFIHFHFDVGDNETRFHSKSMSDPLLVNGPLKMIETLFSQRGQSELWAYCFARNIAISGIGQVATNSRKSEDLLMIYNFMCFCKLGLYIDDSIYLYNCISKQETASDLAEIVNICEWILQDMIGRFASEGEKTISLFARGYRNMILALFDRLYFERKPYTEMKQMYKKFTSSTCFRIVDEMKDTFAGRIKIFQIKHPNVFVHFVFWIRNRGRRG